MYRVDEDEPIISEYPYATIATTQLIPAVAYVRVSTRSNDQKNSFENQQKLWTELSVKMGYYLVAIYADRGISGKSLKKRDEFNRMMKDAHKGIFKQVLTTNIARYSRDIVTLQDSIRELRKQDIGVYFLKENINTADYAKTYGDEVMLNILGSLAQNELVQLSKGIQMGMRQAQRDGKWTSQPPYGYDRIDGFLKINKVEAEIVKKIFKWYVEDGYSFYKIANILNEQNVSSKRDKLWQEGTIRKMIDNPIYIGVQINYQTIMLDIFTDKIETIPEADRIKHHFENLRIIDNKTFEKTLQQVKQRAQLKAHKIRYSTANLLSNLFYCGNCGSTMKRTNKNSNFYYICSRRATKGKYKCEYYNYIKEKDIIEYLVKKVASKEMYDNDILKEYYDWYIETNLGKDFLRQLPEVIAKIEKLQKRKQGLIEMKADGELNKDDYSIATKKVDEELESLQLTKRRIDNINQEIKEVYQTYATFINALENFTEDKLSNQLLRKIFKKITITTQENDEKKIDEPIWNSGLDKSFEEIRKEYDKQFVSQYKDKFKSRQ